MDHQDRFLTKFPYRQNSVIGTFYSNDDGQTVAKLKLFTDLLLLQTLSLLLSHFWKISNEGEFPWNWITEDRTTFWRKKKDSWPCVYVLHKTPHKRTSRCSRALTARKWTKTCDAVLLIKSFSSVLLAFTLPSPSSTLKRTRNDGETNSARFLGGKKAQDLRFAILYLLELNGEGRKAA